MKNQNTFIKETGHMKFALRMMRPAIPVLVVLSVLSLVLIGCSSLRYERELTTAERVEQMKTKADAENRELIGLLQQGGYVIYIRHASTDWSQVDIEPYQFYDCSMQRNLDAQGREESVQIGEAFRTFDIPVARVLSSPFCRTRDTAELAFGDFEIEDDLQHVPVEDSPTKDQTILHLWERMDELLAQVPPEGENVVLVSHSGNLAHRVRIASLPEGLMVIFKPDGNGSSELKGMIAPEELLRLY
jgi:phosphohistidine phosphatase SixA